MILNQLKIFRKYDQRGWIPGPLEQKKSFEERIKALEHFFSYPPHFIDHFLTDREWKEAQEKTKQLYDFSPDWIVAYYSNQKLSFFQGAALWILEKEGIRYPILQLKKAFERGHLFQLYTRKEVLSHEAIHAARMEFNEPLYEEIFAYATSSGMFRRFLGPIFQKPWEAYMFIFLLLIPIFIELAQFTAIELGYFSFSRFIPLLFFAYLFFRLLFLQSVLIIAQKRIKKFLKVPQKNKATIFRLKDAEIFLFALKKEKTQKKYMHQQSSLRWQMLKAMYFKK